MKRNDEPCVTTLSFSSVDDTPQNLDLMTRRLGARATRLRRRGDGEEALPGWRSSSLI